MSRKRFYRRILIMLLIAGSISFLYYTREMIRKELPETIRITRNSNEKISFRNPYEMKIDSVTADSEKTKAVGFKGDSAKMAVGDEKVFCENEVGRYRLKLSLFGIIELKNIQVDVVEDVSLYPSGKPIGIYLQTSGVMIIGQGEVTDEAGIKHEPSLALVRAGDYIVSINDIDVSSKSQLMFLINKYGENDVILGIRRGGSIINVKITPVKTDTGDYKLGIWVRDDMQGIGTLTYLTKDGKFGALGHGISDIDTGKLLDSSGGILYRAGIWGINKGEPGKPGGLCGVINYENGNILGTIDINCSQGIYGKLTVEDIGELCAGEALDIGYKQEIVKDRAYIRSNISGETKDYEINIEKINMSNENTNKGIVLRVTDKELLNLTNGIVQGMSGSPIIQNNKIIGAVTHVFVNDSTRGYGIFIEEMINSGRN